MDVKEGGSAMLLKIALFLASPSYIFFTKKCQKRMLEAMDVPHFVLSTML